MHLLRMMRNLVRSLPSDRRVRLLIIGDGPELSQLEKFVRQNGLTNVVQMVGRRKREEIREIYSSADVFVAPANLESFGIAALEARCAGLPVIAKQQTGIREFVEHEKEGLLARDDRDMTALMRRIVLDDELRNRMAQHNQTVTSSVDWQEVCRKNIEAYQLAIDLRTP